MNHRIAPLLHHTVALVSAIVVALLVLLQNHSNAVELRTNKFYTETEITIENPKDAVTLAGTFTQPQGKGPFPAVVLITGAGPQDRDEAIGPHKPFAVISDNLGRRGIAVLRMDDRGVGKSAGNWITAGYDSYSQDVRAGLKFLKSRPEIDGHRVGLLGHSEGGIIGSMVAANNSDVRFLIMLASPCVPEEEFVLRQNEQMLRHANTPEAKVRDEMAIVRDILSTMRETGQGPDLKPKLLKVVARKNQTSEETDHEVDGYCTAWAQDYMTGDVTPSLKKLSCPLLAVWGSKDQLVEPEQNVTGLRKSLSEAQTARATIRVLPDLNHLFQKCQTGSTEEFFQIKEAIDPGVLQMIADWVSFHTHQT